MQSWRQGEICVKAWPFVGIVLMQLILCTGHWFLYHTWVAFWPGLGGVALTALRVAMLALTFSFMVAAMLSFRMWNAPVRWFYKAACIWLGFLNFFFLAACLSWLAWYGLQLAGVHPDAATVRPAICVTLGGLALAAGLYGMANALHVRIRRLTVKLPNLPESWRGRRAVVVSDVHLGNVNGAEFCQRVVRLVNGLEPEIVLIPGDVFDGTLANLDELAAPLKELRPPLGVYFSAGNHEEFGGVVHCLAALRRAGVHVLNNERVVVDGVTIAGVPYGDSTFPVHIRATLEGMKLDRAQTAILLNHAPTRLPIVEQAGFSLQLSGHTHGGQVFPFTWFTHRVFGKFTHGLHRFGALTVYTSTGVGTWGPPMRVASAPEIVALTFEQG